MRRYKVLTGVFHTADGTYEQGDELEADMTPDGEAANLDSGLLELQPLKYRVVGESEVLGTKPGEEFEFPMRLHQEALLVEGGHIEPVAPEKPKAKPRRKPTSKKEG